MVPRSDTAITARALPRPRAVSVVPSIGSTAMSVGGGDAVADALAVEQHRGLVLLALADDDDAVHRDAVEHDGAWRRPRRRRRRPCRPGPSSGEAASAAASVTRTSSRARLRSGSSASFIGHPATLPSTPVWKTSRAAGPDDPTDANRTDRAELRARRVVHRVPGAARPAPDHERGDPRLAGGHPRVAADDEGLVDELIGEVEADPAAGPRPRGREGRLRSGRVVARGPGRPHRRPGRGGRPLRLRRHGDLVVGAIDEDRVDTIIDELTDGEDEADDGPGGDRGADRALRRRRQAAQEPRDARGQHRPPGSRPRRSSPCPRPTASSAGPGPRSACGPAPCAGLLEDDAPDDDVVVEAAERAPGPPPPDGLSATDERAPGQR